MTSDGDQKDAAEFLGRLLKCLYEVSRHFDYRHMLA